MPGEDGNTAERHHHDLHNHVAIILGFADLLIAEAIPGDRRLGELREIQAAAKAALEVVARLSATV